MTSLRWILLSSWLLLGVPTCLPVHAQPAWWHEVKQARQANRKHNYLEAQKLFMQALQNLEKTNALSYSQETTSLSGMLPDMERSFSRTFRDLSPAQQKAMGAEHNRQKVSRTRRLAAVQQRLLGPQHKATLDTLKHLRFLETHNQP